MLLRGASAPKQSHFLSKLIKSMVPYVILDKYEALILYLKRIKRVKLITLTDKSGKVISHEVTKKDR